MARKNLKWLKETKAFTTELHGVNRVKTINYKRFFITYPGRKNTSKPKSLTLRNSVYPVVRSLVFLRIFEINPPLHHAQGCPGHFLHRQVFHAGHEWALVQSAMGTRNLVISESMGRPSASPYCRAKPANPRMRRAEADRSRVNVTEGCSPVRRDFTQW